MRLPVILILLPLAAQAYNPPKGIPAPSWTTIGSPIDAARPSPPSPWTSNTAGFYYVSPGGSNSGNGYPGSPKGSIPTLAAGDVCFLSGDFPGTITITAPGTTSGPIWVTSYDTGSPAEFSAKVTIHESSSYLFIDNVKTDFRGSGNGKFQVNPGADHLCFRNIDLGGIAPRGATSTSTSSAENQEAFAILSSSGVATGHIVIWNNNVHDIGNWIFDNDGLDPDAHGVSFGDYVTDVHILDNTFSYGSGNAVQIGAGTNGSSLEANVSKRIYVGRNTAHHFAESGFWVKQATDVIFSENTAHTMWRACPRSPNSAGFGCQYGPSNVWWINNRVYDVQCGFQINGASSGTNAGPKVIMGNLAYNIHDDDGDPDADWRTNSFNQGGVAVSAWAADSTHGVVIVNNTFDDFDAAILCTNHGPDYPVHVAGNLLTNRNEAVAGGHIILSANASSTASYNIIPGTVYTKYASTTYTTIAALNAAKGPGNDGTGPTYANAGARNYTLQAASNGIGDFTSSAHAIYGAFFTDYGLSIAFDRAGTARPQDTTWDIGAYEYTAGGGATAGTVNAGTVNVGVP